MRDKAFEAKYNNSKFPNMRIPYNNYNNYYIIIIIKLLYINRDFATYYDENDDEASIWFVCVHMYIKYIESATNGGAKETADCDAYIL